MSLSLEKRLAERYGGLSEALQQAADHLVENPIDIATRPLRLVSLDCGVSPATFSRLSRALGYSDFKELREEMRQKIDRHVNRFADRAEKLQHEHSDNGTGFFDAHMAACQSNLREFSQTVDHEQLERTADRISSSRKVLLMGSLGSTGVVEYLSYLANFCVDNWTMASRMGASLGGGLTGLDERDAMIIVTKPPFSGRAIRAAEMAQHRGVYVVLITDSRRCPALKYATESFLVPTESPHFYSSYVVTMFLVEALIGMVVSQSGEAARERIAKVEDANRILAEVWDE